MTLIAFAGCWHARPEHAIAAIVACNEIGVKTIVHTGDFMYTGNAAIRFQKSLERVLSEFDMQIVVVRGNHDEPALYEAATNLTNLRRAEGHDFGDSFARITPHILHAPDGLTWAWDGVRFGALGGAHSVDWRLRETGTEWWIDEQTPMAAVDTIKAAGALDILVMHDVPSGIPLRHTSGVTAPSEWDIEGAEYHRLRLRDAMDSARPQYVISGHMHTRQTEVITLPTGEQVKSVILDRIDSGRPGDWSVLSRNLLLLEIANGQITPVA